MSRIGNNPIPVPSGVTVKITPTEVSVKGPKGELGIQTHGRVAVAQEDGSLVVRRFDDARQSRAYHGLYQRLITNLVLGVTEGFKKELEIQGVGYRAAMKGRALALSLGFSHPVELEPPKGITFATPTQTEIVVEGADKQLVGEWAARIRGLRPPEPYKGKGVRYKGEYVRKKVGKSTGK